MGGLGGLGKTHRIHRLLQKNMFTFLLVCAYAPERDAYVVFSCLPKRLVQVDANKNTKDPNCGNCES